MEVTNSLTFSVSPAPCEKSALPPPEPLISLDIFETTSFADIESVKFEVTPHTSATLLSLTEKITAHIFSKHFYLIKLSGNIIYK